MRFALYDRRAAVLYAHRWAYGRNPAFYDYEHLGGDCTNFASQCIYAGSGVMNFTPTFGWYYIDPDQKAPAWTGVPYLYNFLVREEKTEGPAAHPCELGDLRPGDLLFFWNSGRTRIYHTGIWLGGGKYIHASSSAGQVVVSGWSDWAKNSFSHGKRVY